jgi:PAS domain S-box-containing protein
MPGGERTSSVKLALEVSELRYRRLFETAQDGILILDAETGRIIDVNPFLLDLLDYPFKSILGLQLWEIGLFEDIAANRVAFEKLQTEEYIRYENHPLRTQSGKQIQVEFVSKVYFVGSEKVIQCNIREIGERVKAFDDCRHSVATLELAGKTRDHVLAMLSHEFRTPLAAISYATEFLELGYNGTDVLTKNGVPPPEPDQSAIGLIRRNVGTLTRMISELLDLTQIAKGRLHLKRETIDVHEVIQFALKNLEGPQKSKGVEVRVRLQAPRSQIRADWGKLEQVISNLISNALKFTPPRGTVSITTRNDADDNLVVEISDTGIGISPDALERIFAPFEQADPSIHPRFGGLGLGLSIAHTFTEAQGGTLTGESVGVDQGARFIASFKLDDSKPISTELQSKNPTRRDLTECAPAKPHPPAGSEHFHSSET